MQARTAFRLAMLENGFQPLLNDCKRSIEKGWPQRIVDAAEVSQGYKRQLAERRTQRSPEGDSPTDAGLDELIGRYGADRIMAALDRVTAPQRVAAG